KMHEYLVYSQSMQPGGKGRLSAKAADLAKQLDKDFLCQIFGLDDISSHAQAERIYSAVVPLVKLLEGSHVTFGGPLGQLKVRTPRCFCLVVGHQYCK